MSEIEWHDTRRSMLMSRYQEMSIFGQVVGLGVIFIPIAAILFLLFTEASSLSLLEQAF